MIKSVIVHDVWEGARGHSYDRTFYLHEIVEL